MNRRFVVVALLALTFSFSVCAFAQEHEHPAAQAGKVAAFDKTIMQKVWDAWCTLDAANAAKFYSKEKSHVFYDIAPLKYRGWDEYDAGSKKFLATVKSLAAKVNYDGEIHTETPNMVWTNTTVNVDMVTKDGKEQKFPVRWTAIWHRHGTNWVIAHEHVSAAMPE